MKIVLGLGNPGESYEGTRHNVGFMVVDAIRSGSRWREEAAECGLLYRGGRDEPLLVKPLTFVNESGRCAKALMDRFKVLPQDMLVISDELQLPIGQVRLGAGGSAGGHNGLQSVIDAAGTENFARLRIGIRSEEESISDLRSFVLGGFRSGDIEAVRESVGRAAEAALLWSREGIAAAMNRFNRKE